MADIEIYSGPHCPYCNMAKKWFDEKKISYQEHRIDQDPKLRDEMLERSGGKRTIPQIFINKKSIGGYDDLMKLVHDGEIEKYLDAKEE
jgi:glutaredoxin 3